MKRVDDLRAAVVLSAVRWHDVVLSVLVFAAMAGLVLYNSRRAADAATRKPAVRARVVTTRAIAAGTTLTATDLLIRFVRVADSETCFDDEVEVSGRRTRHDLEADHVVTGDDLDRVSAPSGPAKFLLRNLPAENVANACDARWIVLVRPKTNPPKVTPLLRLHSSFGWQQGKALTYDLTLETCHAADAIAILSEMKPEEWVAVPVAVDQEPCAMQEKPGV
jgi:hypothetical protein